MKDSTKRHWISLATSVFGSLVATTLVAFYGYHVATTKVAAMIGEGVRILNVEGTSKSLDEIVMSCQAASALLSMRESRPASSMIIDIRKRFESFSEELDTLSATVPPASKYTGYTYGSAMERFVEVYSADVRQWRDAHFALLNSLTAIDKTLESLDQQLYPEPTFAVD